MSSMAQIVIAQHFNKIAVTIQSTKPWQKTYRVSRKTLPSIHCHIYCEASNMNLHLHELEAHINRGVASSKLMYCL